MRARVLINGGAGSVDDEEPLRRSIVEAFERAGAEARVEVIDPGDIAETVRAWWAAPDRPDVVVVAGGDGTVNAAAAAAIDDDVVLSVLPLGTFNHFAKDLGLPDDLDGAAVAITAGEVRAVDVAEVNGEVFVNNAALGVYPAMVAIRERLSEARGWGKVRAVPVASAQVLRDLPVHRLDLRGDGFTRNRVRTPFVFVGNGSYDASGAVPTRESLDDGVLDVAVARTTSRWALLRAALRAFTSGADSVRDLDRVELAELTIDGRPSRLRVARDGEVGWLDLPLRFRCRAGALRVRGPAPGDVT